MQQSLPIQGPVCENPDCARDMSSRQGRPARYCSKPCGAQARRLAEEQRSRGLGLKVCRQCGEDKPLDEYRNPGMLNCQPCMKLRRRQQYQKSGGKEYVYAQSLASRYGMTITEYRKRVDAQDGRCAICGDEPERGRLHVDHDHETGAVRDLLCRYCNHALGNAKDDPKRLLAMVTYLERHARPELSTESPSSAP